MPEPENTSAITLKTLILSSALLLVGLLTTTVCIGYWAYQNVQARFLLKDQSGWISFPESLEVGAEIRDALQVEVNQSIPTKVPINQAIDIPVPNDIHATVTVDTSIPIKFDVAVEDTLIIDQIIPIDTVVQVTVAGIDIGLPIKGDIPIKAAVPLELIIPINNQVPLAFTAPVTLRLDEPLHARLDTVLDTIIPIKGVLDLPVTSDIEATLRFPSQPIEAGLYYFDLSLPLKNVEISTLEPLR